MVLPLGEKLSNEDQTGQDAEVIRMRYRKGTLGGGR